MSILCDVPYIVWMEHVLPLLDACDIGNLSLSVDTAARQCILACIDHVPYAWNNEWTVKQSSLYLHATFNLTVEDVRMGYNDALHRACRYGHLEVVKYLCEKFGLTTEDVHLDVIKYLYEKFGSPAEDARFAMGYGG